jgi:hypothetical protein
MPTARVFAEVGLAVAETTKYRCAVCGIMERDRVYAPLQAPRESDSEDDHDDPILDAVTGQR